MKLPKYLVQKFEQKEDSKGALVQSEILEEDTYFVIRSSDVFGAAALYSYAHLIQTGLELDRLRTRFTEEESAFLEQLAEAVVEKAQEWQKRGDARLPD